MIRINEEKWNEKYILIIPSMLDAHFPILKYAFFSHNYHPVILENEDNITETGLKYVNNDMCYPGILNVGQIIAELQTGKYDLDKVRVLMPSAGDACRGSNYTGVLKRALSNAGLSQVKVLSLNLKGIDKNSMMKINPLMLWRALFGLFYGDVLMLLVNQTRPYEIEDGAADALYNKWVDILVNDLKNVSHMTLRNMFRNFDRIARDFSKLERIKRKKQRIGIVGELYIKYCHIGNWNIIKFLEENGCESHTNGLSWYALYYMDSHLMDSDRIEKLVYKIGIRFFTYIQNKMINALKKYDFYTLENFHILRSEGEPYVSHSFNIGDGWLIGSEIVSHILHDCPKVLAVQPFGCMPNHCCGRGLYPSLQRKLSMGMITSVDVDSSGTPSNVYNRVRMLIDWKIKNDKEISNEIG